nr:hypothetical protein [Cupriavidus gilardii]
MGLALVSRSWVKTDVVWAGSLILKGTLSQLATVPPLPRGQR